MGQAVTAGLRDGTSLYLPKELRDQSRRASWNVWRWGLGAGLERREEMELEEEK